MAFSGDSQHFVFAGETRNRWSMLGDLFPAPSPPTAALDEVLLGTLAFVVPPAVAATKPSDAVSLQEESIAIARKNDRWRLLENGAPVGEPFDLVVEKTFTVSPDRRHFAFAASRDHRMLIVMDGAVLATCDEVAASTFAFSPDSRHLAYAAQNAGSWSACVDSNPGAPFAAIGATPIGFSPDSTRIAYDASTGPKAWHLVVGLHADEVSKPFEAFLKGSHLNWRADGTLVTIAIEKKVAMRVEAKP